MKKKRLILKGNEFGGRLKDFRLRRKLSLDALSKKSGVSKGMLSHIERNISVPTIESLQKIAGGFGVPLSALLPEKEDETYASRDGVVNSRDIFLVRKDRRKKLIMPTGDWFEMLCPDLKHRIELIELHYPVGGVSGATYSHEGEECGVLLEGKLKGIIGDQTVILEAGDSIYHKSSIPHRWENIGDIEARAIWAISPPSF